MTVYNKIFPFCAICIMFLTIVCCSTPRKTVNNNDKYFQEIETYLQSMVDNDVTTGLAIAVTKDQEIVYSKGFGVRNIDTKERLEPKNIFHVASVSKPFTAAAVMQLYEKGMIDIDQPLTTYLPYFKMKDERYKKITIKQMLNHTSGMPDVGDYEWEKAISDEGAAERFTRRLIDSTLISVPGAEYHYSNTAFDIMADLIAKVSGMSFEKYMKENILVPLGMNESSFYYPEVKKSLRTSPHIGSPPKVSPVYPYNRMHAPSSTLNSNVLEMSHWAIVNMYSGKYKNSRILSPDTHLLMITPTLTINKERDRSVAISWFLYPYREMINIEHGGSDDGYRSLVTLIPERKIGIILLCNLEETPLYDIRNKVRDILIEKYEITPQ